MLIYQCFKRCFLSLTVFTLFFAFSSTAQAQVKVVVDPGTQRIVALETSARSMSASCPMTDNACKALSPRAIADRFISENIGVMGLKDPSSQLVAISAITDQLGMSHVRYEQKHRGVSVFASDMVVHLNPVGEVTFVTMGLADGLPASVTPSISGAEALKIALTEATVEAGKEIKLTALPAKLYVLPLGMIQNAPNSNTFLAWEIKLFEKQSGGFSNNYYINASTGAVALKLANKETLNRSAYDCAGGTCRLDFYNSTYNYYYGRSESAPLRGPSPITFYVPKEGEIPPLPSKDVDNLHTLLGSVHTFVSTSFGINGANNQGGSSTGLSPNDQSRGYAHWNGSICPNGAEFEHQYGDLHFCLRMTAPDTVGHEYAHAVVFHSYHDTSGNPVGTLYYGQSGALNEGNSDFFGELFETYATSTTDWKSGTDSAWTVLFNLAYPPDAGYRTDPGGTVIPYPYRWYSPGVYCGTSYDNAGVHVNGSIISHMFYRMAVGGGENGCYVQSIGTEAAKQIFYRAFAMNYLSRTATFAQAYSAFEHACSDLYPTSTCDQVRIAMQAAEINQGGLCSGVPEAAPACAAMGVTSWSTWRPGRNGGAPVETFDFAPGETMIVRGCGNTPNRLMTLSLRRHFITPPSQFAVGSVWSSQLRAPAPFGTTFKTTATSGADGCFETSFPALYQEIRNLVPQTDYDIGVDGDNSALWEPWSDSMLQRSGSALPGIKIVPPLDGDGICRVGQYVSTSEDCMNAPLDCGCSAGLTCVDTDSSQDTNYQCRQIPPACFLAGTAISMSDGSSKAIEEIKVGDRVKSFDESSGLFVQGQVIGLSQDKSSEYLLVNGTTKVTANHRFYLPPVGKSVVTNSCLFSNASPAILAGGEWVEIGKLRPGAMLLDQSGKFIEIKSIARIKESAPVFNFQVSPYPTYIANGIVVHNRKVLEMMQALGD
jgi:bacillolysin